MSKSHLFPIEKFISLEVEMGESILDTLNELNAMEKNWYLSEDEQKILAESNDPDFDFEGLTSTEKNNILDKMKNHRTDSTAYLHKILESLSDMDLDEIDNKYNMVTDTNPRDPNKINICCSTRNETPVIYELLSESDSDSEIDDDIVVRVHNVNGEEIYAGSFEEHKKWLENLNNEDILKLGLPLPWKSKYSLPEDVLNGSKMHPIWG